MCIKLCDLDVDLLKKKAVVKYFELHSADN